MRSGIPNITFVSRATANNYQVEAVKHKNHRLISTKELMKEQLSMKEVNKITVDNIAIMRPGGNDTALVPGLDYTPEQKKRLNDVIMAAYPNVEQVGFYDLSDPENPVLMMAGGEFCGNATRSVAYLALQGKEGTVNIRVSSVERPLQAGVNENGDAWAEMPLPEDKAKLCRNTDIGLVVQLEGITQVVTNVPEDITDEESAKAKGKKILEELNLMESTPAAGVMFFDGQSIQPVVWVRNEESGMETLFYETACGSGTTAVGIKLALESGANIIRCPIFQPSGEKIEVTVITDNGVPQKAYISGPVTNLESNASVSIDKEVNGSFTIEQITNRVELNQIIEAGLPELYAEVFSEPPYSELFTKEEVVSLFREYLSQEGLIFIAKDTAGLITGFGVAIPLSRSSVKDVPGIATLPENSWYMADLGVRNSERRQGIAKSLVLARLAAIPKGDMVVMRTAKNNEPSQNLYTSLGFEVQQFTQTVTQLRENQQVESDERIFMTKVNL